MNSFRKVPKCQLNLNPLLTRFLLHFSAQIVPVGTAYANGLNVIASGISSKNGCRCLSNTTALVPTCLDSVLFTYTPSVQNVASVSSASSSIFSFSTTNVTKNSTNSTSNATNATKINLNPANKSNATVKSQTKLACSSIFYLSSFDTVTDGSYLNQTVILTGGPGQGQVGKISSYDAGSKMAVLDSDWQMSTYSVPSAFGGQIWWKIGAIRILKAGGGYSSGVWRLPKTRFANASFIGDEGWGTFSVNNQGSIVAVDVWNVGFYGSITGLDGVQINTLDSRDIVCNCPQRNRTVYPSAVLQVDWYTRQILAPSIRTSYIIVGPQPTESSTSLHNLPSEPQHSVLVCEAPDGDGYDLDLSVESYDQTDSAVTNCPSPSSRGFEYGAMDFFWSLQAAVRQPLGIKSLKIVAMCVDPNSGEIYLAANVLGSCQETVQGCLGFVSSMFPNRGLFASGDFQPLIVSPVGAMASIIAKLSKDGQPAWLTQIDTSDSLGQVEDI